METLRYILAHQAHIIHIDVHVNTTCTRMDIERMNEIGIVSPVLDIPRSCYMYEPSEYSMFIIYSEYVYV